MANTFQVFRRIQSLQIRYLKALAGKESLLRLIYESEVTEQVYNSNAIENSTLSLEETDKILNRIDLDRFVNERELFEAKNLAWVVEYIDQKATHEGHKSGDVPPFSHAFPSDPPFRFLLLDDQNSKNL